MNQRVSAPLGAIVSLAWLLAGTWTVPAQAVSPRTLRIGLQDLPGTLDPAIASSVTAIALSHACYGTLVGFDDRARPVPALAERFEPRDGGTCWRFTLRNGLRFHDGRPLESADVVATFERLLDPATHASGASFFQDVVGARDRLAGRAPSVAGLRSLDARTIEIRLDRPDASFLARVATSFAGIVPRGTPPGRSWDTLPAGSGPMRVVSHRLGEPVVLERVATSPLARGLRVDRLEVITGLTESLEAMRFERGELDAIGALRAIGGAEFARLRPDPRFASGVHESPDLAVHYLGLNTRMPPFDDPRVRRAAFAAIDRTRLIRLYNGRGRPAARFVPPGLQASATDAAVNRPSPELARRLLAEAGHPGGVESELVTSSSATPLRVAQALQQDLAQAGIRVRLRSLALPAFLACVGRENQAPCFTGNWTADYPDAGNFLVPLFASSAIQPVNTLNRTFLSDAPLDRLLALGTRTTAPEGRMAAWRQAEDRLLTTAAVVPLIHPLRCVLVQPRVTRWRMHPVWPLDLEGIELEGPR
ncbi:MAG: ABC transporter substrate-binding protein [bacterium]|nr:ABC transporter substrate-binding protein [bacterium]